MNAPTWIFTRHAHCLFKAMIAGLFPDLLPVGGVQLAGRQTAAALAAIAEEGAWPCIFLSLHDPRGEHEIAVGDLHFRFRGFQGNKVQFVSSALRLARAHPHIIFTAHPNLGPVAEGMRLLASDAHIISGTHGVEIWHPMSAFRRRALRRAHVVLAPSSDTARKLNEVQGVDRDKIQRLAWPLDPGFCELARFPQTLPLPAAFPRGRIILTVGRWAADERYKGADCLIRALAELAREVPDVHLVLIGSGDDLPRLKKLAENTGVSGRTHFFSGLSRPELVASYAAADVFALPSTGEGFGFVFLEAMALAKPVIGTPFGGIPDIVSDGETGVLLNPENAASLVNPLRRLLDDPGLRRRMGQRGAQVIRSRFGFSRFQQEWKDMLGAMNFEGWQCKIRGSSLGGPCR